MGIRRSVAGATLCQSKVETETRIITATSAAIGMTATTLPRPTTSTSRNAPAAKVERRVRAPDAFTLIIVWPIIAQPAMPPKKPVMTLAMPWPRVSRSLSDFVSVMSSTSLAVISDSSRPTAASVSEYGAMIVSVCSENGTAGSPRIGSESGSAPSSPTVGTSIAPATTATVSTTIATSGAGIAARQPRHEEDQREAGRDERAAEDAAAGEMRHLGQEDEDRQGVDEAGHHRARDEPHQLRDSEQAEDDLDHAGEDRRGQQVLDAVLAHEAHDHERHRAGRGGDHGGPAADEGDRDGHRERGEEADTRVDAGDDRERDRLGDQGEGDDEAGEQLDAQYGERRQLPALEDGGQTRSFGGPAGLRQWQLRPATRAIGRCGRTAPTHGDGVAAPLRALRQYPTLTRRPAAVTRVSP